MGIDLLDITFRIEKVFGNRIPPDAWPEVGGMTRGNADESELVGKRIWQCWLRAGRDKLLNDAAR